jgi:hypothetical protein
MMPRTGLGSARGMNMDFNSDKSNTACWLETASLNSCRLNLMPPLYMETAFYACDDLDLDGSGSLSSET